MLDDNCKLIVGLKIKLILLAVTAQSLHEFEDYKSRPADELSSKDRQQWTRTELNLGYLVEHIEPRVLQLEVFSVPERPMTFNTVMKAYRQTSANLRNLENYIVPTCNSEIKLSRAGVHWNPVEGKYARVIEDQED